MKIRMLTTAAGPDGVVMAGDECDVSEAAARSLIAGCFAISLETKTEVETRGSKTARESPQKNTPTAETTAPESRKAAAVAEKSEKAEKKK